LKVFKITPEGQALSPAPGSREFEAIARLKNEITALGQGLSGLPKLLDSNEAERWIITEYFPEGTLEHHPFKYRGEAGRALEAFRSLVQTVSMLHKEGYVHRDVKPANVFIRSDNELVLGDFGIVFLPHGPDRVTQTGERVGPRDYMPHGLISAHGTRTCIPKMTSTCSASFCGQCSPAMPYCRGSITNIQNTNLI